MFLVCGTLLCAKMRVFLCSNFQVEDEASVNESMVKDLLGLSGGLSKKFQTYGILINSRAATLDSHLCMEVLGVYAGRRAWLDN